MQTVNFRHTCHRCGRVLTAGSFVRKTDGGLVIFNSETERWGKDGDKYYCPVCLKLHKTRQ